MEVLSAIVESMQSVCFPAYITTLCFICLFHFDGLTKKRFFCQNGSFYGPKCEKGSEDKVAC